MPGYSYAKAVKCFFTTLHQLRFPILTIASVLGLAFLMNYAGMSSTLGLAFTQDRQLLPLLCSPHRLAGRVPHRFRHFGPTRCSAACSTPPPHRRRHSA